MSLARDEVALKVLTAGLSGGCTGSPASIVADAVAITDALLAALSPAPVPAATVPTPYAPKVGDVVRPVRREWAQYENCTEVVVVSIDRDTLAPEKFGLHVYRLNGTHSGMACEISVAATYEFVRPATAAERAAAGLPVDAAQQPTPAYPVDAAGRPLWVRVTALNGHRPAAPLLTVGRIYKVTGWSSVGCPSVTTDYGQDGWWLSRKGNAPDPECPKYPAWEPCAAPAETPAIAPTPALEPRRTVGAVVRTRDCAEFVVVAPDRTRRIDLAPIGDPRRDGPPLYDTDVFVRWATREECERHGVPYVARPLPGAPLAAPSPAATPAAWVPSVGDVVTVVEEAHRRRHAGCEWLVKEVTGGVDIRFAWLKAGASGAKYGNDDTTNITAVPVAFVRRATSSERAAAGLPVDESAPRDVVTTWDAKHSALNVKFAGPNVPVARTVSVREDPMVNVDYAADGSVHSVEVLMPPVEESAIEFNEAQERDAARKAWLKFPRPFDGSRDGYVEGWVDALRARVAAKGGAS